MNVKNVFRRTATPGDLEVELAREWRLVEGTLRAGKERFVYKQRKGRGLRLYGPDEPTKIIGIQSSFAWF